MNLKTMLLSLWVLASGSLALGVPVQFSPYLVSEKGAERGSHTIAPSQSKPGLLDVTVDPNFCDPVTHICTRMPVRLYTVEAKVIRDDRPTDGDLILGLMQEMELHVGSGYNVEGVVTYTLVLERGPSQLRIPMKVRANLELGVVN